LGLAPSTEEENIMKITPVLVPVFFAGVAAGSARDPGCRFRHSVGGIDQ
jgi:hypothetical protein